MKWDALVIGGGPGGSVAATLLAKAGWRVVVIEKTRFPRKKVCGEFLSATNLPLFEKLGLKESFCRLAGPEVRRVGLFARDAMLMADMPRLRDAADYWGQALDRAQLDSLLLQSAGDAGASVRQPWSVSDVNREGNEFVCRAVSRESNEREELRARVVIAAHNSWESGGLPTHPARIPASPGDLFGFKAGFAEAHLPEGLMPVVVFPGGYGGMVQSNQGRVSFSCCIRRDRLEDLRRAMPNLSAGEAVLAHVRNSCRGVREVLSAATAEEPGWLSVGPIRPGIRPSCRDGIFLIGNAAGEAHPIVAEGISMAMQSAWLLTERLIAAGDGLRSEQQAQVAAEYGAVWKRSFAARIRTANVFANLAMRPAAVAVLLPLFRAFPRLLTLGARWSGKARSIVPALSPCPA